MKFCSNKYLPAVLLLIIAAVVTFNCYSCSSSSSSSDNHSTSARRDIPDFVANLEADGFIVQEGKVINVDLLKLCSEGLIPSCYANNAGAPYVIYTLPPSPGQNPAKGQQPPVGYDPNDPNNYPKNPDQIPVAASSKLRPDEALVLIGKTPPKCKYFSYNSYVCLRENIPGKDYTGIYQPGDDISGKYHRVFASLGDTLNPMTMKTSGTPDGQVGNPYSSNIVIVTTADRGINERVRTALVQAGFPSSETNNDVLPSGILNMGLEKGNDTFLFLHRLAMWENEELGQNYLNNLDSNYHLYRITSASPSATNPYPVPELTNRGTGTSEFHIAPWIEQDMETLRQGIIAEHSSDDYTYTELTTSLWIPEGYVGIANDQDCLGDNRDTTYISTPNFQFTSDDDFLIVYGVDHTQTGKSTYNNVSFYGAELLNGVANVFSRDTKTTAYKYFPEEYEYRDYFYSYKIARKKTDDEPTLIIPYSTGNPNGFAYGVDNNQDAFLGFRAYLEPETKTGPSYFEIMYDRAIMFKKK